MGHAAGVAQQQRRAFLRLQPRQRALDVERHVRLGRRGRRGLALHRLDQSRDDAGLAAPLQEAAVRDGEQPGAEARRSLETVDVAVAGEKGVLSQVLRPPCVGGQPPQESAQRRLVASRQFTIGVRVPRRLDQDDQLAVAELG